ncbi:hypothetical protein [Nocardioides sp. SYSU DS0663]|uniref:hypothetical protein n=1 Tax=Nocardioides sp. SYSU DS0663 TaxID=3416445 RepID=UPI003F4B64E7
MSAEIVTYCTDGSWFVRVDDETAGSHALRFSSAVEAAAIASRLAQRLGVEQVTSYGAAPLRSAG